MPSDLAFDSSQLPVPASEAEVTAGWLQNALLSAIPGVSVHTVEAERIGEAYGLASRIFRYRWEAGGSTQSVIVKLWSTDSPAGMTEALFYRTFGAVAGARIPACFHAAVDPNTQRGVLLLEDLGAVIQGDFLQQLAFDQAKAVALSLASIHATWLQHTKLHQAEWMRCLSRWERDASWFAPRRALFLQRFGGRLDGLARLLLDEIDRAPAIANDRMEGAAITLLHNDLHLDNFVFEGDTEPVILDWAQCAKGPAALDLYDLLFGMTKPQDIEKVLVTYLNAFEQRSAVALDPSAIRRQLGGAFLRKFATGTCGIARWQPASRREAEMIETGIQRTLHAVQYWSSQDPALFACLQ